MQPDDIREPLEDEDDFVDFDLPGEDWDPKNETDPDELEDEDPPREGDVEGYSA